MPDDRTGDTSPAAPQAPAAGDTDGTASVGSGRVAPATGDTDATPPAASGSGAPVDPEFHAPWYTERGMLGEATVREVSKWEQPEAEQAARRITEQLGDDDLARQLRTPLTELFAESTPAAWQKLLREGRLVVLKDRLVWLRPVVDTMVPVRQGLDDGAGPGDPVRKYQVRFNATSASDGRSEKHAHGLDTLLFTAVNLASAAASTLVVGAPHVSVETSSGTAEERKRTVITGHKTVVEASVPFEAAVRVRVFADGHEVGAKQAERAVAPRGLVIELPSAFVRTDNLRPVDDSAALGGAWSASADGDTTSGSFHPGGEVVNAVDLTATVAALQEELRRRGLDPRAAKEVVEQALPLLNESAFRNNSQWWLTSGLVSPMITRGRRGFQGYFRARATLRPGAEADARPVGVSTIRTRLDLGGGMTRGTTRMKKSAVVYQVLANVAGWVHPAAQPNTPPVKGYAPMLGVGGTLSRQVSQTLQSQSQTHAIFTVKGPHVRYDHTYDIELEWRADDGKVLFTIRSQAPAETAVPLRAEAGEQPPGPVAALPYVRQVRRQSGLDLPRTMVRPKRLDAPVTGPGRLDGRAGPPRALALGRGLGFAVGSALPGAELVEDHLRHVLEHVRHGGRSVRWDAVDRLLSTHFGRPALEGNLADLMAGVQHTIDLGGKRVRIRVRVLLPHHVSTPPSYPMTVNNRAAVGETTTPRSVFSASLQGSAGAAPRFRLGRAARLQLTALAHARRTWEFGEAVGDEAKTYRRMETDGLVDEHRFEAVYELAVAYGPKLRRVEKWWIDHPGELLAKVVVPRQHAPAAEETHDGAGHVTFLRAWPDDGRRSLSFRGGASGVYPSFLHTTALPALAVSLMHGLNGRPAPAATDWTQWPDEVVTATGPGELASYFGQLVGVHGREIPLPDMDGWHQALTLRLRVDRPRAMPRPEDAGPTEIEQYLRSSSRRVSTRGTVTSAGARFGLGLQERFGSDSGNDIELADPHDITGPHDGADTGPLPGGRLMEQLYVEGELHSGDTMDTGLGSIEVTRVTYENAGLYRADAVFEVTLTRWRNKKRQKVSRVLRVTDGLDLEIPPRRAEDVLPATPPAVGPARQPAEPASASHGASLQRASVGYLGGRPLHTAVHPETFEADGVLPAIIERLTARGILDERTADAPTELRRALKKAFRSETLETQWQALADEGVHQWFVVDEESTALSVFGGTERHLLVSVELVDMAQAHDHRPREDARLTLRGESIEDSRGRKSRGRSYGWGATVTARAGQHDSGTQEQGHGGLDGTYGSTRRITRTRTGNRKVVDIYRANTRDDSHEFTHGLTFRVRLALTTRLPEVLDSIGWLAGQSASVLGGFLGRGYEIERAWQSVSLWSWQDDGGGPDREIPGTVRLLVPTHLTVEAPQSGLPLLPRSNGVNARWVSRQRPDAVTAGDPGAPGTPTPKRVAELLTDLHPWDMPAARVIREWAKVAAERTRRAPDLRDPRTRSVPAAEHGTRTGLFYGLDTKHGRLRARISDLLAHTHTLDVAGRSVTVGIDLTAARPLDGKDVLFKSRRYQQNDKDDESGVEWIRNSRYEAGPEGGGGAGEDLAWLGRPLYSYDREHEGRVDGGAVATVEHNQEAIRPSRYYVFDVTVVMRANGRELRVDVPDGLTAMLPVANGRPAPEITAELGRLFTDVPSLRADRSDFDRRLEERMGGAVRDYLDLPDVLELRVSAGDVDGLTKASAVRSLLAGSDSAAVRVGDADLGYADRARLAWRLVGPDTWGAKLLGKLPALYPEGETPETAQDAAEDAAGEAAEGGPRGLSEDVRLEGAAIYASHVRVPPVIGAEPADVAERARHAEGLRETVLALHNDGGERDPEAAAEVARGMSDGSRPTGLRGGGKKHKKKDRERAGEEAGPTASTSAVGGSGSGSAGVPRSVPDHVRGVLHVLVTRSVSKPANRAFAITAFENISTRAASLPKYRFMDLQRLVELVGPLFDEDGELRGRLARSPDIALAVYTQPRVAGLIRFDPALVDLLMQHPAVLEELTGTSDLWYLTQEGASENDPFAEIAGVLGRADVIAELESDRTLRRALLNAGTHSSVLRLLNGNMELVRECAATQGPALALVDGSRNFATALLETPDPIEAWREFSGDWALGITVLGTQLRKGEEEPVSYHRTLLTDRPTVARLREYAHRQPVYQAVLSSAGALAAFARDPAPFDRMPDVLLDALRDTPTALLRLLDNPEALQAAIDNAQFADALGHRPDMLDDVGDDALLEVVEKASVPPEVIRDVATVMRAAPNEYPVHVMRRIIAIPTRGGIWPDPESEAMLRYHLLSARYGFLPAYFRFHRDGIHESTVRDFFDKLETSPELFSHLMEDASLAAAAVHNPGILGRMSWGRELSPWLMAAVKAQPLLLGHSEETYTALAAGDGALLRLVYRQPDLARDADHETGVVQRGAGNVLGAPTLLDSLSGHFGKLPTAHWGRLLTDGPLFSLLGERIGTPTGRVLARVPEALREAVARPAFTERWKAGQERLDALSEQFLTGRTGVESLLAEIRSAGPPVLTADGLPTEAARDGDIKVLTSSLKQENSVADVRKYLSDDSTVTVDVLERYEALLGDERLRQVVVERRSLVESALYRPGVLELIQKRPTLLDQFHRFPALLLSVLQTDGLLDLLAHDDDAFSLFVEEPSSRDRAFQAAGVAAAKTVGHHYAFLRRWWDLADRPEYRTMFEKLAASPSVVSAMVERPDAAELVLGSKELRVELADADEVTRQAVVGTDGRLAAVAPTPRAIRELAEVPALARMLADDTGLVADRADWELLLGARDLVRALDEHPDVTRMVVRQDVLPVARSVPGVVKLLGSVPEEERPYLVKEPVLRLVKARPESVDALLANEALRTAVVQHSSVGELLREDGTVFAQLVGQPELADALVDNSSLIAEAGTHSQVWKLVRAHPELRLKGANFIRKLKHHSKVIDAFIRYSGSLDAAELPQALKQPGLLVLLESDRDFLDTFLAQPEWQRLAAAQGSFVEDVQRLKERKDEVFQGVYGAPETLRDLLVRSRPAAAEGAVRAATAVRPDEPSGRDGGEGSVKPVPRPEAPLSSAADPVVEVPAELVELLAGRHGVSVATAVRTDPELLVLLASDEGLTAEVGRTPDVLTRHRVRPYLEENLPPLDEHLIDLSAEDWQAKTDEKVFERSFGVYRAGLGAVPYDRLKAAAFHTWRKLVDERSEHRRRLLQARTDRFTRFRPHLPHTWDHSGRIHYAGQVRKRDFTAEQQEVLERLAGNRSTPQEGTRERGINLPSHAHLDGGSGGAAVFFALAADGLVDLVVYAVSHSRPVGNTYTWSGGTHTTKPPTLERVINHPVLETSIRLVTQGRSAAELGPEAEERPTAVAGVLERNTVAAAEGLSEAVLAYRAAVVALEREARVVKAKTLLEAASKMTAAGADVFAAAWEAAPEKTRNQVRPLYDRQVKRSNPGLPRDWGLGAIALAYLSQEEGDDRKRVATAIANALAQWPPRPEE